MISPLNIPISPLLLPQTFCRRCRGHCSSSSCGSRKVTLCALLSVVLLFCSIEMLVCQTKNPSEPVFYKNVGQIRSGGKPIDDVLYVWNGNVRSIYITNSSIAFVQRDTARGVCFRTDLKLDRSNYLSFVERNVSNEKVRFYIESDSEKNFTPVKSIVARGVYPGIDWYIDATLDGIKQTFVVAPGADPSLIKFRFLGSLSSTVTADGELETFSAVGSIVEKSPIAFTTAVVPVFTNFDPKLPVEEKVAVSYRVNGSAISYEVGSYDTTRFLIIDPEILWSQYLGGSGKETIYATSTDDQNNIYVCGETRSFDFPLTIGAIQNYNAGGNADVFIAKYSSSGARLYSTFLGSLFYESAHGIAFGKGLLWVTGETNGTRFPTTSDAIQQKPSGVNQYDCFLLTISPTGELWHSTLFGGSGDDFARGLVLNKYFEPIICGYSTQADTGQRFPVTSRAEQLTNKGQKDLFAIRFGRVGRIISSTLLGGSGDDVATALQVTQEGGIVLSGRSDSRDFPIRGSIPFRTPQGLSDAIVARFDADFKTEWATYLGGRSNENFSAFDNFGGIAVDPQGNTLVAGWTESSDFPVSANGFQRRNNGGVDCFVSSLSPTGQLRWSTFLGGAGSDLAHDLVLDKRGNVRLCGWTSSQDFPMMKSSSQGKLAGGTDWFVASIDTLGLLSNVELFGGNDNDFANALAADRDNNIIVTGNALSTNFPMQPPGEQFLNHGATDAVVLKMSGCLPLVPTVYSPDGSYSFCQGASMLLVAEDGFSSYTWSTGSTSRFIEVSSGGIYSVRVMDSYGCSGSSFPVTVTISDTPKPRITYTGDTILCGNEKVVLDAGANYKQYQWSNGWVGRFLETDRPGTYSVAVIDSGGCFGSSEKSITIRRTPALNVVQQSIPNFLAVIFTRSCQTLRIVNSTPSSVVLDSSNISLRFDREISIAAGELPVVLQTGDTAAIRLCFQPDDLDNYSDTLFILKSTRCEFKVPILALSIPDSVKGNADCDVGLIGITLPRGNPRTQLLEATVAEMDDGSIIAEVLYRPFWGYEKVFVSVTDIIGKSSYTSLQPLLRVSPNASRAEIRLPAESIGGGLHFIRFRVEGVEQVLPFIKN